MDDKARQIADTTDDDGVELLAQAMQRFDAGDVYQARGLARAGRARVTDPEAVAEAEALLARLGLDRIPMLAAAGLLVLVLLAAAVAAS